MSSLLLRRRRIHFQENRRAARLARPQSVHRLTAEALVFDRRLRVGIDGGDGAGDEAIQAELAGGEADLEVVAFARLHGLDDGFLARAELAVLDAGGAVVDQLDA